MNGDSKYKMFRNFMVNELGIGKADIEQWTKEAVAVQVEKLVGQINIDQIVTRNIESSIKKAVFESYGDGITASFKKIVREALAEQITIAVTQKPK